MTLGVELPDFPYVEVFSFPDEEEMEPDFSLLELPLLPRPPPLPPPPPPFRRSNRAEEDLEIKAMYMQKMYHAGND